MKTLNKFRNTNVPVIGGEIIDALGVIKNYFEIEPKYTRPDPWSHGNVIAIAYEPDSQSYTLRISNLNFGITDFRVKVFGDSVEILESEIIMVFTERQSA